MVHKAFKVECLGPSPLIAVIPRVGVGHISVGHTHMQVDRDVFLQCTAFNRTNDDCDVWCMHHVHNYYDNGRDWRQFSSRLCVRTAEGSLGRLSQFSCPSWPQRY